jgi:hypothetical protein
LETTSERAQAIYLQAQNPDQEICLKKFEAEKRWIHCYMDLRQLGAVGLLMSV